MLEIDDFEFHHGSAASRRLDTIGTTAERLCIHSHVYLPLHPSRVHQCMCATARVWLFASQRYHRWCIPVIENELSSDLG